MNKIIAFKKLHLKTSKLLKNIDLFRLNLLPMPESPKNTERIDLDKPKIKKTKRHKREKRARFIGPDKNLTPISEHHAIL